MSAAQIIEEIRALPADEQEKVYQFLHVQTRRALARENDIDDKFKQRADEIFTKNAELFRKLAE
jgi:hypothetical protein